MINKEDIITLDNDKDYLIKDIIEYNNNTYYFLLRVEDESVTEDILFLKKSSNDSLELIDDGKELNEIKEKFLNNILNNEEPKQEEEKDLIPTPHIEAKQGEIAPLVIMPGDPLRAKFIAETYLENSKLVSDVRNIYAFTGDYKGTKVTVMAAGMGMPSAGIYYHELFKFYGVEKIIRIGTCGATVEDENIMDVVIANKAYTNSNFAETYTGKTQNIIYPSKPLTDNVIESSKEKNIPYHLGGVFTMDFFGPYIDVKHLYKNIPEDFDVKAEEMECFGLFLIANSLNKEAACILTIVDTPFKDDIISSEDREKKMNNMIEIALDAIIKN